MGGPLQRVAIWSLQDRRRDPRARRPWVVRWGVEGRQFSRAFTIRVEAEHFRSLLVVAHRAGDQFDVASGEPVSWRPASSELATVAWVRRWLAEQWPEWLPRTRGAVMEAVVRFVPLVVAADAPRPPAGIQRSCAAPFHLTASTRTTTRAPGGWPAGA